MTAMSGSSLGDDSFTISLPSLKAQGPIWFAEKGVFITESDDPTTAREYIAGCAASEDDRPAGQGAARAELRHGFLGQPRPHAAAWSLGFKNCRQRFWQDPNGDITLESTTVRQLPAADTKRYANDDGHGRFFFGLEDWIVQGRGTDPAPALVSSLRVRKDDIEIEQTSLAAPLDGRIEDWPDRRRSRPGLPGPVPAQERRAQTGSRPGFISSTRVEQLPLAEPLRSRSPRAGRSATGWCRTRRASRWSLDGRSIRGTWHDQQGRCGPAWRRR